MGQIWHRFPLHTLNLVYGAKVSIASAGSSHPAFSILIRWMKLEPIIQSEVSQKDKDHYNILTHIYGI